MTTVEGSLPSPVGVLTLVGAEDGLHAIRFAHSDPPSQLASDQPLLADAAAQLSSYFGGSHAGFDLQLAPRGTAFQQRVWKAVAAIPFGTQRSYGAIASQLGSVARAVGQANGANPLPIVVPCHRVTGHDGRLVGYAGGLERKRWLLEHEGQLHPSLFG
jgi:methylated-DNA-[protein]-cysteine S-methyltransferase